MATPMLRFPVTAACVGLLIAAGLAGCNRKPSSGPEAVATPTFSIDNTRTEGPPLTYEEIERGLVGRWVADGSVTDFQASTEWRFFPDRTWETPTLKGYAGRYELISADAIRMLEEGGVNALFRFHLVGDQLTMYYVNEQTSAVSPPMVYRRLSRTPTIPTAQPTGEASPSAAGTSGTQSSETPLPTTNP